MESCCDLHTHTDRSDGALPPRELVREAQTAGLTAIAVTDHDTTEGLPEAREEGSRIGVEVVPGIELSASVKSSNETETEIHILGYFIRPEDAYLQETLLMLRRARAKRAEQIVEKLNRLGLKIDLTAILAAADGKSHDGSVGRPHIARALLKAGHVASLEEAFDRYLKQGRPGYVPKHTFSPADCIQLIRRAGGLAVIAHPRFGGPRQRQGWEALVKAGLNGIEARHSQHPAHMVQEYERLARELGLLVTGGSDFHSYDNNVRSYLGGVKLPYSLLEALREKKAALDRGNASILG